uniref:Protochlorophyllide reductase ChlB subunit n=1 Tax=Dixoniella grisea TaxID=35153 RepID=UPI001FCD6214|nr:Protochlorophyllide reductase ChlB subunit [Dixoniella grisea]UNJ17139.1 Protochlorophyllide reductase ChlB subunit [Dixoniella grisea]
MKLAYWMYTGPAHIGTLRIASSFNNVHAIMHAPLGDDYFNVMKSMLEREQQFTPVTTSIVDRHVLSRGSQEKVLKNITQKDKTHHPDLIILTPTCTSSILQEDLNNFVLRASEETYSDVLLADVNHYRLNEFQAADQTLKQIIEFYIEKNIKNNLESINKTIVPSVNIIGSLDLGFHNQHDMYELKKILKELNIYINLIIPENTNVYDLHKLPEAWINLVPYREIGLSTAKYLQDKFQMPYIDIAPIGIGQITEFLKQLETLINTHPSHNNKVDYKSYITMQTDLISQSTWFAKSIDCQNLLGKKAVVFGDATHAVAITKILHKEMGIRVLWAGTYCKYDQKWFTQEIEHICDQIVISDNHSFIANLIKQFQPDAIFGTQMERHIGKKLNIPCGVISSPVHIQNFPLGYRPFIGFEGSNQITDLIYNSFTLGMEDHLLEIFAGHDSDYIVSSQNISWSLEAQKELQQIPRFVRSKVKNNTETFALNNNITEITPRIMYEAKEKLSNP